MKSYWTDLDKRFSRLTKRERSIVLLGGVAAILILGFSMVDVSLAKYKMLNKQLSQARTDTVTAAAQAQVLSVQLAQNPDEHARARIAALSEQIAALDLQMQGVNRGLVPPDEMAQILEDMLARSSHVQLIKLQTLPVSHLIQRDQSDSGPNVYKHGIEMTLQGRYLDLLDYLNRLEALPWQMFWAEAIMDAKDYPAVRITVTVFTLSLDKHWLVV
jgi:MSHA biogenesis protein MshJ